MGLLNWLSWLGDRLAHFLTQCSGWPTVHLIDSADFLQHVQSIEANWLQQHLNFNSLSLILSLCNFVSAIRGKGLYFVMPLVQQWLRKIDSCCWNGVKKRGSFWGLFLHQDLQYQLPKFRGKQSADSSAATDRYFPSADMRQKLCNILWSKFVNVSLVFYLVHGAKISSNSDLRFLK